MLFNDGDGADSRAEWLAKGQRLSPRAAPKNKFTGELAISKKNNTIETVRKRKLIDPDNDVNRW